MAHRFTVTLSISLLIGACAGGGSGNHSSVSNESLNGTWYFVSEADEGSKEYSGEQIIIERAESVEITYCDGSEIFLEKSNDQLIFNGAPFYLQVESDSLLRGTGDTGATQQVEKLLDKTEFLDGTFQMVSNAAQEIDTDRNVCASLQQTTFGCHPHPKYHPEQLVISTKYGDSFLRLSIAFKEITVGSYLIADLCSFVNGPNDQVRVRLTSSEFEDFLGENRVLVIESGFVNVLNTDSDNFVVEGEILTRLGYIFSFSSTVDLEDPEPN